MIDYCLFDLLRWTWETRSARARRERRTPENDNSTQGHRAYKKHDVVSRRLLGVRRLVAALVRTQRCATWDQSGDKSPHSKEAPYPRLTLFRRAPYSGRSLFEDVRSQV